MAGLIDSNTGLRFGFGLQWQETIGGQGLIINPEAQASYVTEDGVTPYVTENSSAFYVTE